MKKKKIIALLLGLSLVGGAVTEPNAIYAQVDTTGIQEL